MMKRNYLASLLLVGVLFFPVFSLGADQQFVAAVITSDLQRYREAHEAFVKILRAGGMSEEKVKVHVQTPSADPMSLTNSIRKAVGGGADLIVTYGTPVALVAKKEAKGTPVLFADVYDPVELGLVKDLAVPGGDISGVSNTTPVETLVKALVEIKGPKAILALYTGAEQGSMLQVKRLEEKAGKSGVTVIKVDVRSRDAIRQAVDGAAGKVDAVFASESVVLTLGFKELTEAAGNNKLPIVSQIPNSAERGALVCLEADPVEQGQLLAVHAIQALGGQKVFTLPVRTPKKVALIVNMKVAESLGITVPFQVLDMATRVIK